MGKTAYWLDLHNLLSLLFLATQDNVPGVAVLTVDWALSFQSLTKKMTHRHAHRAPLMEAILQFPFLDESGLFQVEPNYLAQ